jgi:hypothetical protein
LLQRFLELAASEPNLRRTYAAFAEKLHVSLTKLWQVFRRAKRTLVSYLAANNVNGRSAIAKKQSAVVDESDSPDEDGADSDEEMRY